MYMTAWSQDEDKAETTRQDFYSLDNRRLYVLRLYQRAHERDVDEHIVLADACEHVAHSAATRNSCSFRSFRWSHPPARARRTAGCIVALT